MRVLHVCPFAFRRGQFGGGERYLAELLRAQVEAGLEAEVVFLPDLRHLEHQTSSGEEPSPTSWRDLRSWRGSYELLHVHHLDRVTFDVGVALRQARAIPLVLTDLGGIQRTPGRLLGGARMHLIDGLASCTRYSVEDVRRRSRRRPPFEILYGGGDHILRPTPDTAENQHPVATRPALSPVDFLFVGRVLPHKGIHVIVEALPDGASMRIVGELRDEGYAAELRRLAHGKDVEFVAGLDDRLLLDHYRAANATLLPSVWEHAGVRYARPELLGLVMLESLFAGTPCLGSDVAGLGELMAVVGQRAVPPGDVPSWRREMTASMSDPSPIPANLAEFTWASVAARCQRLYERVLDH